MDRRSEVILDDRWEFSEHRSRCVVSSTEVRQHGHNDSTGSFVVDCLNRRSPRVMTLKYNKCVVPAEYITNPDCTDRDFGQQKYENPALSKKRRIRII